MFNVFKAQAQHFNRQWQFYTDVLNHNAWMTVMTWQWHVIHDMSLCPDKHDDIPHAQLRNCDITNFILTWHGWFLKCCILCVCVHSWFSLHVLSYHFKFSNLLVCTVSLLFQWWKIKKRVRCSYCNLIPKGIPAHWANDVLLPKDQLTRVTKTSENVVST